MFESTQTQALTSRNGSGPAIAVRGVGNYSSFFGKAPSIGPQYNASIEALRTVMDPKRAPAAVLDFVVGHLRDAYPRFTWVGVYRLEGDTLALAAWKGARATEHTRIPVGQGICGLAARTRETVVVPDVSKDPLYLACFPSTRSEIVVPILGEGRVFGEIDIDSDALGAFTPQDRRFLEVVADDLARYLKAKG